MCYWEAAIPFALQGVRSVGNSITQARETASAIEYNRRQQLALYNQMNLNDNNLRLEQRDLLDSVLQELTAANMNKVRNMGTIRTAIGESQLEGNTMERIKRVTEGDYLRESAGITENYRRDYSVILGNRYSNYQNAASQIRELHRAEPKRRTNIANILEPFVAGGTGAYNEYERRRNNRS